MGWCSGTAVFDGMCEVILKDDSSPASKKKLLKALIRQLHKQDWDCEHDSEYWDHPLVREIFKKQFPEWFEDELFEDE